FIGETAVKRSQRKSELRRDVRRGGRAIWIVQARSAYLAYKIGVIRPLDQNRFTHLLTDLRRDWIRVRAGLLEYGRVEVPFHAIGAEVYRAVEHSLIVSPMHWSGKGKDHSLVREWRLQNSAEECGHGASPKLSGERQEITQRIKSMATQNGRRAFLD